MNNQMPNQNMSYTVYQTPKRKKDHSTLVIVISIVLAVSIGFFGLIFLFISLTMNYAVFDTDSYDKVTAKVIDSEKKWSDTREEYIYITSIEYTDKNDQIYLATINGKVDGPTVTVYCKPDDYNMMIYMTDQELAIMNSFFTIFNTVCIVLMSCAGVILIGGIILGIVMKKRYKAYLAENQSDFLYMNGQPVYPGQPGQPGQPP